MFYENYFIYEFFNFSTEITKTRRYYLKFIKKLIQTKHNVTQIPAGMQISLIIWGPSWFGLQVWALFISSPSSNASAHDTQTAQLSKPLATMLMNAI